MLHGLNNTNIKKVNNPVLQVPVSLRQLLLLPEKSNSFTPDSIKISTKKAFPVKLINPFQLFSNNSAPASVISKPQDNISSRTVVQWDKQFHDPSVIKGNAPSGYKSMTKEVPMAKAVEAAKLILSKKQALGTSTPLIIDGVKLLAVDQTHHYTIRNGKTVQVPEGLHGVTLYVKKT
jgi:hypothetical protein